MEIASSTCYQLDASTTGCTYWAATSSAAFLNVQDGSAIFGLNIIIFLLLLGVVAFMFNSLGGRYIKK